MIDPRLNDDRADGVERHDGVCAARGNALDEIVTPVPESQVVPVSSVPTTYLASAPIILYGTNLREKRTRR